MKAAVLLLSLLAFPALSQENQYRFSIDQDRLSGAPDFSFLNHPLTPSDRVVVKNGHFYTSGGERVRFFGVNFAFGANFPVEEDAARIARRLRRLGINLVRLHHMDSQPDRDPVTGGSLLTTGPYPTLNPMAVARLRVFLNALKAEGIYVNLNLHVGYEFRPEIDHVPAIPGANRLPTQSKPLHIFYPRMQELQQEYVRKVIEALELKVNPVLAMVEIDNETSLIDAWQKNQIDRLVTADYRVELDRQKKEFLQGRPDSVDETIRFLVDRDRAYLNGMLAVIRQATDGQVPVAGTQVGFGGLLNFDSHRDLDYQDNHFYIDHYNFPHNPWDSRDWRQRNTTAAGTGFAAFLNMAATRQAGRPFTISEFNEPYPNPYAAEIDPTLAAFAAFQDWDALDHFAYEHGRDWNRGGPGGFNLNGDWSKWANFGQSAWLFRTGAVAAGKVEVRIPLPEETRLESARQKTNGNAARFLKSAMGYDANAAFLHRVALDTAASAVALPDAAKSPTAPYTADTGELAFDPARSVMTVNAPQAAGVFGFAGKEKVAAGPLAVTLDGPGNFVTLLVTALDGRPLRSSAHMLLSLPGAAVRQGQKLVNYPGTTDWWTLTPDPKVPGKPSGLYSGGGPVFMEKVPCVVTIESDAPGLAVYPLDGAGNRREPLTSADVRKDGKVFRLHLASESPWYEIAAGK
jgi:hypothetical protein